MAMSFVGQFFDYLNDYARHHFSFWNEDSPFVCEDEDNIQGKIVVVTGCNTGIGKETALQLAKRGGVVIMAVRNLEKGEDALREIRQRLTGYDIKLELMELDLGDLQSIQDFVANLQLKHSHLDILVNNAGLDTYPRKVRVTKNGFEEHIGVNHLGPFLLTRLLVPWLQKAPSTTPSRIICVSSSNLAIAPVDFMDNLMMERSVEMEQYGVSKLCNAVCMMKLANSNLMVGGKVKLIQVCPGLVKTDILRNASRTPIRYCVGHRTVGLTPHQGCETVIFCTVSSVVLRDGSGTGEIYRFKKLWAKGNIILQNYLKSKGLEKTNTLYKLSEELVGLPQTTNNENVTTADLA